MSFSGYDIEDALVLNRASLDRGFGRCIVNKQSKTTAKRYVNQKADRFMGPAYNQATGKIVHKYRHIDGDGIVRTGSKLWNKDVGLSRLDSCLNNFSILSTSKFRLLRVVSTQEWFQANKWMITRTSQQSTVELFILVLNVFFSHLIRTIRIWSKCC